MRSSNSLAATLSSIVRQAWSRDACQCSEPTLRRCAVYALSALDGTRALQATAKHLAAVESAEEIVRLQLGLTPEDNLRVRMVSTIPTLYE